MTEAKVYIIASFELNDVPDGATRLLEQVSKPGGLIIVKRGTDSLGKPRFDS
jgi:hypothetical protein